MHKNNNHAVGGARLTIRFAPGLKDKMLGSVGALEPEHYAVLVGDLADPFYVTDLRPMPPMMGHDGKPRRSGAAVTLNAPFIEYYLNTEVLPEGKYFLGFMHSHPGDMTTLSGGMPGSGQGDVPSMRSHLENAQRAGVAWENYLAPIVTRPGKNPHVTGWVIRLDRPDPMPADIVWESAILAPARQTPMALKLPSLQAAKASLKDWQAAIDEFATDPTMAEKDRAFNSEALRAYRYLEIHRQLQKLMERNGSPENSGARVPTVVLPKRISSRLI